MNNFFRPEDFEFYVKMDSSKAGFTKELADFCNSKRDQALAEATAICKTGSKYGIEECISWLKKWVRNDS